MGFTPFGLPGVFSIIPIIVVIGFVVVFGLIITNAVRGATQWKRNNDAPVLTVEATIITKRTNVNTYHNSPGTDNSITYNSAATTYYVTFQVASGDRLEFQVPGSEYGMLAENDRGRLTFQGTRYLGFERVRT